MSDAVVATPKPAKAKKAAKPKKPASHPKYSDMIKAALTALKEKGGSSRQAILKYIIANNKVDAEAASRHLRMALKAGVKNGTLKQSKGTGASGSFKLGESAVKKPKAKAAGEKKPKKVAKSPAKAKKAPAKPKAKKAAKPKKAAAKK
uniref:H15 domain-containing protein n=1 Tax=Magallana gigas TaxID=29159 RepID=A0A8W8I3H6_MAGGI